MSEETKVVKKSVFKRITGTIGNILEVVDETSGLGVDFVSLGRNEVKILDGMQTVRMFETKKEIKAAALDAGMPQESVDLLMAL